MRSQVPSAPASEDRSELVAAVARDNANYDYYHKQTKRSVRGFWTLLRDAFATVWSAARAPFVWALLLTLLNALIAVAQVLVTKQLLDAVLVEPGVVRLGPLLTLTKPLDLVQAVITLVSGLAAAAAALVAMRMLAARLQAGAGGSTTLYESRLFLAPEMIPPPPAASSTSGA